ncbi:hypothetical protein PHYSODRAFT_253098 [Phytophthora sojae]|uniref:Uncharacterized protein n=1 Tax=Phytophthora sojae (strain P6497) TaxID=1094619 RepID=G4ZRJ6_PHYSP|nr:hypothetical protein PHYSODRAFT_253098 [Phytophthora sojae]EGZ14149.1 hypothetical protein PHYSODRAFT_253098 [Phytophthora sojae]|eukprot:XP_009531578.1 hypothetical protein PHYSODRAFT_253098 [Phytophthora sojae]
MTSPRFFYLKPHTLDTAGFAYGSGQPSDDQDVEVHRVASGRWSELNAYSVALPLASVSRRGWRVKKPRVASEPVETYAMRLCEGQSTLSTMPAEMRAIHEAAYSAFHARGRGALRSLEAICNKIGVAAVEETGVVPVFDISSMQVAQVSAKHVLDFVFYHDGNRRPPPSVKLGDSIFDDPAGQAPAATATARVSSTPAVTTGADPLQDSDDDSDNSVEEIGEAAVPSQTRASTKRGREGDLTDFGLQAHARPRLRDDEASSAQLLLDGVPGETGGKGQFRASRLQNTVHQAIVNVLVEHVQAQIELLAFLPHPAVLKGFFAWEFGTRGLSLLHFGRIDATCRRQLLAKYDMCDFSSSNELPRPVAAKSLDDILAALDVLAVLVEEVYQPFVGGVIKAARKFFLLQKTFRCTTDEEELVDLVFWMDERLESAIQDEFNVAHESFVQVQNIIHERRLGSLQASAATTSLPPRGRNKQEDSFSSRTGAAAKRVPEFVLNALPIAQGRKLCMRYLSNQGCRSTGPQCTFAGRGHFRPQHLSATVREFIESRYGGLKPEFKDL